MLGEGSPSKAMSRETRQVGVGSLTLREDGILILVSVVGVAVAGVQG